MKKIDIELKCQIIDAEPGNNSYGMKNSCSIFTSITHWIKKLLRRMSEHICKYKPEFLIFSLEKICFFKNNFLNKN